MGSVSMKGLEMLAEALDVEDFFTGLKRNAEILGRAAENKGKYIAYTLKEAEPLIPLVQAGLMEELFGGDTKFVFRLTDEGYLLYNELYLRKD